MSASTPGVTTERLTDGWATNGVRCSSCGESLTLRSDDEPGAIALGFAPHVLACDKCATEYDAAEARRSALETFGRRLKASGLPTDLHDLKWAHMDRTGDRRRPVVGARAWSAENVPREHSRLFLYGPYGTGKTRLAATATWSALEWRAVTFMSVPILLQAAFAPANSEARRRAVEAMMGFGALVLDDLGKEKPGDWARQVLFGAIDSRIQAGSPILITSNMDADELAGHLGAAFGSRLSEFGQYELSGEDRRRPPERRDLNG